MDNHHFSEAELEAVLHHCRNRLDILAMADAVPAALNRIRQTPTRSHQPDRIIAADQPTFDPASETGEPAQHTTTKP